MRKLILVKHAAPQVVPGVPPEKWTLSEQGKQRCGPLAEALRAYQPEVVVSSLEPKADETGELVAGHLALPFEAVEGPARTRSEQRPPHAQPRVHLPDGALLPPPGGARAGPRDARTRPCGASKPRWDVVLVDHADQNVAVVSHGTVIALFVAKHGGGKAYDLWRQMGLPSFRVLGLPAYEVEAAKDAVG